jgi:hypothetical protein
VKTDIWPDDTSMRQMNDWLAGLRDDGEEPDGRQAGPAGTQGSQPEPSAASALNWPVSPVEIYAAKARAHAEARAHAQITARAVIGDQLRMPIMWCEMGSCISWHIDAAALGEADIRARVIAAGWRVDALGRLACPRCQQSDGRFWATHPVRLHDRSTATAAADREDAASAGGGAEAGIVQAVEPRCAHCRIRDGNGSPLGRAALLVDQGPGGAQSCGDGARP